jgi:site-specific recombinase XerD
MRENNTNALTTAGGRHVPGAVIPARAAPFIEAARSANTRRAYKTAWEAFCAFCATTGSSPRPADASLMADYLTHLAESGRKVATINMAASAIPAAHRTSNLADPTKDESIRLLLTGIRRKLGTAPAQKAPAMRAELTRMLGSLPAGLAGSRDRALLLLGFAGAFRRSELVALDVADLQFNTHGLVATVKRSKTDQEGAGVLKHVPQLQARALCPVTAVRAWLDAAEIRSGPVFRKVDRWGHVRPGRLNDRAVALIIKRAAAGAGLEPRQFAGHSLRAGLATQAAADGVDTLAIREVTGHKSDAMLARYVRSGGAQARQAVRRALGER